MKTTGNPTGRVAALLLGAVCAAAPGPARGDAVRHQVTGLFMAGREQDLAEVVAAVPGLKLVSVDFGSAEAVFDYDPAKLFPGAGPGEHVQRLDGLLRTASRGTFGVKPLRATPPDRLRLIEIPVAGLDCKACSLAAYEAVYRLEGVERATASFREGRVTALIDPDRTSRARLEEALRRRGVDVRTPAAPDAAPPGGG